MATAVRELDREVVKIFLAARTQKYSWEEWRVTRGPAENALERFVEAVRSELSLPQTSVALWIADIAPPPASELSWGRQQLRSPVGDLVYCSLWVQVRSSLRV